MSLEPQVYLPPSAERKGTGNCKQLASHMHETLDLGMPPLLSRLQWDAILPVALSLMQFLHGPDQCHRLYRLLG